MPEGYMDAAAVPVPDAGDDTLRAEAARVLEVHEIEWISHEDGWDCGCNERGELPPMPSILDAKRHQADALLPLIREHTERAVEQARADERETVLALRATQRENTLLERAEAAETAIEQIRTIAFDDDTISALERGVITSGPNQYDGLSKDEALSYAVDALRDIRATLDGTEATP